VVGARTARRPRHAAAGADPMTEPDAPLTFLSLFAGIGGLDLGLERAGWRCVGQVEVDPYCQRVLERHWPTVRRRGDIRLVTDDLAQQWWGQEGGLEPIDAIVGGFP
jgi:DNA (cytosine-5)-methyltransferase 1